MIECVCFLPDFSQSLWILLYQYAHRCTIFTLVWITVEPFIKSCIIEVFTVTSQIHMMYVHNVNPCSVVAQWDRCLCFYYLYQSSTPISIRPRTNLAYAVKVVVPLLLCVVERFYPLRPPLRPFRFFIGIDNPPLFFHWYPIMAAVVSASVCPRIVAAFAHPILTP